MFKHAYILTGGIGSGKSTVCTLLKLRGFEIVDADLISHESFNENIEKIEQFFGTKERKEIARSIFGDKTNKKWLEELLHPIIAQKIKAKCKKLDSLNVPYIVDIPLFFESDNYDKKDTRSVLVYTPKDEQIRRVIKRDNMSLEDISSRIDAQMDIEEKRRLADFVIDNSKDITQLQNEVERFIEYVRKKYDNIKI